MNGAMAPWWTNMGQRVDTCISTSFLYISLFHVLPPRTDSPFDLGVTMVQTGALHLPINCRRDRPSRIKLAPTQAQELKDTTSASTGRLPEQYPPSHATPPVRRLHTYILAC